MKNLSKANPLTRSDVKQQLEFKVLVEPSSIDFLREDAVFAAGCCWSDCCGGCGDSFPFDPVHEPKRRSQRVSQS
jgi:hypothetical protein